MTRQRFTIHQDADGTFRLAGSLTVEHLDYLKFFLDEHLSRVKNIALDLGGVEYWDVRSLQLLIAYRKALPVGSDWKITGLSAELENILLKSGLKTFLCP